MAVSLDVSSIKDALHLYLPELGLHHVLCLPILAFFATKIYVFCKYAVLTYPMKIVTIVMGYANTSLWYDRDWLDVDNPAPQVAAQRRKAFSTLMADVRSLATPYARIGSNNDTRHSIRARIPVRVAKFMQSADVDGAIAVASYDGNRLVTAQNKKLLDVGGSLGVNILGHRTNKELLAKALQAGTNAMGVLSADHLRLEQELIQLCDFKEKANFSQTELYYTKKVHTVSFHNSGTEAMEAVCRLSRYNTNRKFVVTFDATYHGWGPSTATFSNHTASDGQMCLPLFSPRAIEVISHYAYQIAAVIFNPMTCLKTRYNDNLLALDRFNKSAHHDEEMTNAWLKELEQTCSMFGLPLVFDEVYGNFRLGPKLSYHYLTKNVQPDVVVLGKTIANGLPVGIAVGSEHFLRRQNHDFGFNKSMVVGTFSGSMLVQQSVATFLDHIKTRQPDYDSTFALLDQTIAGVNQDLSIRQLPISLSRVGLLVSVNFARKSPYNWLLQFYMLQNGLYTSCYGSSRLNFNLEFSAQEFAQFRTTFVRSVERMCGDGWYTGKERNLSCGIYLGKLLLNSLYKNIWLANYDYVMLSKKIDLDVSHQNRINFMTHYFSSSLYVPVYIMFLFTSYKFSAVVFFILGQVLRQAGHFLFEADHSEGEKAKIGFRNSSKRGVIGIFCALNLFLYQYTDDLYNLLLLNLVTVIGLKVATACVFIGFWKTTLWLIKIITDPFTDIADFGPSRWMDYFTDPKVREATLQENFIPKFAPGGKPSLKTIGKITTSYISKNDNDLQELYPVASSLSMVVVVFLLPGTDLGATLSIATIWALSYTLYAAHWYGPSWLPATGIVPKIWHPFFSSWVMCLQKLVFANTIFGFSFDAVAAGYSSITYTQLAIGLIIFAFGQFLNFSVFNAIGVKGVMYGCRYGHVTPWVEGWPFNFCKDPQYCGLTLSLLGLAVIFSNFSGVGAAVDNAHVIGPLVGDFVAHTFIIAMERGEDKKSRMSPKAKAS